VANNRLRSRFISLSLMDSVATGMEPAEEEEEQNSEEYEQALEMNRRLKAMLAQQAEAQPSLASHGRSHSQIDAQSGPANYGRSSTSSSQRSRSLADPRVQMTVNQRSAARSSYGQSALAPRARVSESSNTINRRRFNEKVAQENQGIACRLSSTGDRLRPRGQDHSMPPGYSRGVGGRVLPPPKLRWGSKKFDAGDWVA